MSYTVIVVAGNQSGMTAAFEDIPTMEEAETLAQVAIREKSFEEMVFISPSRDNSFELSKETGDLAAQYRSIRPPERFERVVELENEIENLHKAYITLHRLLG